MWLAIDENGMEGIYNQKPLRYRDKEEHYWIPEGEDHNNWGVYVPKGTIERLLNYPLTWDDEAEEITEYKKGNKKCVNMIL